MALTPVQTDVPQKFLVSYLTYDFMDKMLFAVVFKGYFIKIGLFLKQSKIVQQKHGM